MSEKCCHLNVLDLALTHMTLRDVVEILES